MAFIEAPTTFYLGRRYDPGTGRLDDDVVYYDSRDLMTHAVVVGMTGSGKTGLCITLLEEAILDNIPAIIIDPKGDITNLLLTFPELRGEDFAPWINPDEARRAGMEPNVYAADVAQRWKDGLQSWGIVPDRIRWLKAASQYSIYTPGSDAGLPISILASLRAPREGWQGREEIHREKISGITTALLTLTGRESGPTDKEHVLIANIFENAWMQGYDLTLEDIILQIQKPPFEKLGVFPIDQYMSEKARFKLAMEMNSIIAAPSFQSWLQGQPIDIPSLLRQPNGRPRVSVFYIAHLSETERQFMITLLLENLLGWMRTQSGTTSLRALLYIDEMFGYFPPYPKNPPTKEPILRLLKQARAFGVGLILATQNPGDLDYKGLTNAGTWFIGRLQSDNDKQKVMAGLQSLASADEGLDLKAVEMLISDIAPRVFLMRNVHDTEGPILLHTRWAMNYLSGPLTRQQIQYLMHGQRQQLMQQVATNYGQQNGAAWVQPVAPSQYQAPPPSLMPGVSPQTAYPAAAPSQYQVPPPPPLPGMPAQQAYPNLPTPPVPGGVPGIGQFSAQSAAPVLNPQQQGWNQQAVPQVNPSRAMAPVQSDSQALSTGTAPKGFSANPPPVSSQIVQHYFPARITAQQAIGAWEKQTNRRAGGLSAAAMVYDPVLLAQLVVRYQDRKANVYVARVYAYHVPDLQRAGIVRWEEYFADPIDARALSDQPFGSAAFGDLPPGLSDTSRLNTLKREVVDMLYNTARLTVPFNLDLKIYGNPDEDFGQFQAMVEQAAREQRDAELDKLAAKYGDMVQKLEERRRRKEMELRSEQKELKDRKREELFTTGEALHGLWQGRTAYTLSRMSRSTRMRRQTGEDISESRQALDEFDRQIDEVEQEFEVALQQVNEKWARIAANTQEYTINALKKDIQLELYGIGWIPNYYLMIDGQPMLFPAY